MKNFLMLFIVFFMSSCGSNEDKAKSDKNENVTTETFSFTMSWKDNIIKDSIYSFNINGDADSLAKLVVNQNGGTLTKISDGSYQLEVTRNIDSVRIVVMKRVAIMNQDIESGSFKIKPVKTFIVPVISKNQ